MAGGGFPERWRLAGWPGVRPAAGVTGNVWNLAEREAVVSGALVSRPRTGKTRNIRGKTRRRDARRASRRDASAPTVDRLSSGHWRPAFLNALRRELFSRRAAAPLGTEKSVCATLDLGIGRRVESCGTKCGTDTLVCARAGSA